MTIAPNLKTIICATELCDVKTRLSHTAASWTQTQSLTATISPIATPSAPNTNAFLHRVNVKYSRPTKATPAKMATSAPRATPVFQARVFQAEKPTATMAISARKTLVTSTKDASTPKSTLPVWTETPALWATRAPMAHAIQECHWIVMTTTVAPTIHAIRKKDVSMWPTRSHATMAMNAPQETSVAAAHAPAPPIPSVMMATHARMTRATSIRDAHTPTTPNRVRTATFAQPATNA